jgi:hypothetical protein
MKNAGTQKKILLFQTGPEDTNLQQKCDLVCYVCGLPWAAIVFADCM